MLVSSKQIKVLDFDVNLDLHFVDKTVNVVPENMKKINLISRNYVD